MPSLLGLPEPTTPINTTMLSLLGLPEPITLRVLELASEMHVPEDGSWKHRLRLLAVCSELRRLALPLVFRDAILGVDDAGGRTSIDLITRGSRTPLVKTVHLTLDAAHPADVLSQFAFATHPWAAVRALRIRMLGDEHTVSDSHGAAALGRCMAQSMRRVTCVELTAHSGSAAGRVLGDLLVHAYAGQLRVLRSTVGLQFPGQQGLPLVECLSLTVDAAEQAVPRVDARRLRWLALRNVALPPPWPRLAEGPFARLRHLELEFCHPPNAAAAAATAAGPAHSPVLGGVSFPALERLWLDGCASHRVFGPDGSSSGSSLGVLPAHLREVKLFGNACGLRVLSESAVASAERLHVSVDSEGSAGSEVPGDDAEGFYRSTNRLFGTQGLRPTKSSLMLFHLEFALDPRRVAWDNLVSLSVLFTIEYSVVYRLLQRLPGLRHLTSYVFDQTELPVDPESTALSIDPLETHLQMVCIYNPPGIIGMRSAATSIAALELLVLQTQSLRMLVIHNPELFHAVRNYVNRFKSHYVHLNHLQVKAGDYHLQDA
ncbi:hypothetical protein LPJ53_002673 [Coemansia erecta]|uniref:Uncharacterized protein n=1 Tax=Coemansia erecta TaxID=147472 RepID=A0A9W7Y2E3_9FUNG|nr:hypothetical protein LPJ53_002673 [Coemansia erecta]